MHNTILAKIDMTEFYSIGFNSRNVDLFLEVIGEYNETKLITGEIKPNILKLKKSQGRYESDILRLQDTSNFVISDRMYQEIQLNGLTGWNEYDIEVTGLNSKYYGFQVTGKCGKLIRPEKKGFVKGLYIEIEKWNGEDFFILETTTNIICTEKAKSILKTLNLPSIEITNVKEYSWYNA